MKNMVKKIVYLKEMGTSDSRNSLLSCGHESCEARNTKYCIDNLTAPSAMLPGNKIPGCAENRNKPWEFVRVAREGDIITAHYKREVEV